MDFDILDIFELFWCFWQFVVYQDPSLVTTN